MEQKWVSKDHPNVLVHLKDGNVAVSKHGEVIDTITNPTAIDRVIMKMINVPKPAAKVEQQHQFMASGIEELKKKLK